MSSVVFWDLPHLCFLSPSPSRECCVQTLRETSTHQCVQPVPLRQQPLANNRAAVPIYLVIVLSQETTTTSCLWMVDREQKCRPGLVLTTNPIVQISLPNSYQGQRPHSVTTPSPSRALQFAHDSPAADRNHLVPSSSGRSFQNLLPSDPAVQHAAFACARACVGVCVADLLYLGILGDRHDFRIGRFFTILGVNEKESFSSPRVWIPEASHEDLLSFCISR